MVEENVIARNFIVASPDGKPAATLGMIGESGVGIRLWSANGTVRAALAFVEGEGPVLQLYKADGNATVTVGITDDDSTPSIYITHPAATETVAITMAQDGPVIMFSRDDTQRMSIVLDGTGPMVRLSDTSGQVRIELTQTTNAGPRLLFRDAAGEVIATTPDS